MANRKIEIVIDDVHVIAELYVDEAPIICNMILNNPGQTAIIQHAKLNGELFFGTLPYSCEFENKCRGGDLTTGDIAFYNPRNQLCFLYGKGTDEPLPISKIGRIVEGMDRLKVVGMKNWLHQGSKMTIVGEVE